MDDDDHPLRRTWFLAELSHELRTPLSAVIGFADAMRSQAFGPLNDRYAEHAGLIHEAGRHMLDLIDNLSDLARIDTGHRPLCLERFDISEIVAQTARLMRDQAQAAGIVLTLPANPSLPVRADRRAIRQILLNLLSNAVKFTPPGGAVTIALRAEGGDIVLTVTDTGGGVAAEDLPRLGVPYERAGETGPDGVGLGLFLTRALCRLHGGDLAIESAPGQGTVALARLPIAD